MSVILIFAFGLSVVSFSTVSAQTSKRKKSHKTLVAKKKTVKKKSVMQTTVANPSINAVEPSSGKGSGRGYGTGVGTGSGIGTGSGYGTGRGSGEGNGTGSGYGTGQGSGDGIGNGQVSVPATVSITKCGDGTVSTRLKITSKPRAVYTDEARQNQIQGTIRLRVTFNADGTIGNVSPISGLGYGLTEKAIEAARRILFEPEIVCNKPRTITKTLEYFMTIY